MYIVRAEGFSDRFNGPNIRTARKAVLSLFHPISLSLCLILSLSFILSLSIYSARARAHANVITFSSETTRSNLRPIETANRLRKRQPPPKHTLPATMRRGDSRRANIWPSLTTIESRISDYSSAPWKQQSLTDGYYRYTVKRFWPSFYARVQSVVV